METLPFSIIDHPHFLRWIHATLNLFLFNFQPIRFVFVDSCLHQDQISPSILPGHTPVLLVFTVVPPGHSRAFVPHILPAAQSQLFPTRARRSLNF